MIDSYSHSAYQDGFRGYRKNKGEYCNPYAAGTNEHNLYERGWTQALKRYPGLYVRPNRNWASRSPAVAAKSEDELKRAKDHYLRSKGE